MQPTPLLDRWREACLHALVRADTRGTQDRHLAAFIGEYFLALHSALEMVADPRLQTEFCTEEAARFLAMLAAVPERSRDLKAERTTALQDAGLVVFPERAEGGDPPKRV